MRVTTKGRSAVSAMVDLAMHQHAGPVALSLVSARIRTSLSYLESLFGDLRRHQLVESRRGPAGGYTLARAAELISVADVMVAVDDSAKARRSAREEPDEAALPGRCTTEALWRDLSAHLMDHLGSVSLRMLVDQQLAAGAAIDTVAARAAPIGGVARVVVVKPAAVVGPNSIFAMAAALNNEAASAAMRAK